MRPVLVLALGLALTACSRAPDAGPSGAGDGGVVTPKRPVLIGHAGAKGVAPEDTVASLVRAIDDGVDLVECDVRLTKDGEAVLLHDETVDRTTDGTGAIEDLTLAEVKALDAGSWMGAAFAGERVPTLREAITAVAGRVPLYLDVKVPGAGARIAETLAELSLPPSTLVLGAPSPLQFGDFATHLPDCQVVWESTLPDSAAPEFLDFLTGQGVDGIETAHEEVTDTAIATAHQAGLFFWTYSIDDAPSARAMVERGVDGMESDHPAALVDALAP